MGDAVNLAARLEQAAGPGEIVMGPQTWRLVHDAVTAEPLEPLRLKGKSQPVTAYRLLQIRDADPHRDPSLPRRRWWAATVSCACSVKPSRASLKNPPAACSLSSAWLASASPG